jgi:hypothetical protein
MQIEPNHKRGPQWAVAYDMVTWIPDLDLVIHRSNQSASNWLSQEAIAERITRRERNPLRELPPGRRGAKPRYEYNVASVRRRVRELMGAPVR